MQTTVFCIAGLLIGGIPFGYLVGRVVLKDDIRRHGSGNIGATNVGRVLGWKWGSLVLVLDALKGLIPTLTARFMGDDLAFSGVIDDLQQSASSHRLINLALATGVCAIIGHMYPVYLKLRGGKGVATALGVVLVVAPWASLAGLCAFAIVVGMSRIVALASICAAAAFAIAQLWMIGSSAFRPDALPLTLFSIGVPGLIIWRHRSNILRLLRGDEKAFKAGGTPGQAETSPE
ncbi:MAG: glycerol-3-phosphate 1-O-acyltransferase PlsY [Planctomycetaceae bacterium]